MLLFEQNIAFPETPLQDSTNKIVQFYIGKGKLSNHQNGNLCHDNVTTKRRKSVFYKAFLSAFYLSILQKLFIYSVPANQHFMSK